MAHNNSTGSSARTTSEWGWLDDTPPTTLPAPTGATDMGGDAEWLWLERNSDDSPTVEPSIPSVERPARIPAVRRWIAPILTTAAATAVIIVAVSVTRSTNESTVSVLSAAAPTVSSAAVLTGACTGLSATTVTASPGDTSSVAGVIAAFEYAYYEQRSADAALRLLAPDAGITVEPLAAGIASIPAGTTHCVAVTPIADTTADVHLVELHPDHTRTDYLQVINLRHTETGLLINNIQRQG
ncbi:hypothetical protein [Nocardia sp. NPDC006630]|uniref:hypothetical protein n=1 Tax=Nocardia sp. NPDC006630 TaxID=3157181 RepID=UPI0033A0D7AB